MFLETFKVSGTHQYLLNINDVRDNCTEDEQDIASALNLHLRMREKANLSLTTVRANMSDHSQTKRCRGCWGDPEGFW